MKLIHFLILIVLHCPFPLLAQIDPDHSYKIGYVTDLTGKAAFWGTQSTFGAVLAVRELKEAGINIEIAIEDCQMLPAKAITAANRLVSVGKVDVLMSDFTPPSISTSEVAKRAKKLFVYLSPVTSILESNPYAFKSFLDYQTGCKNVAKLWKASGVSKVANLKLNAEFGELCLRGSQEVYPDLYVIDYNSGDDLRTEILKMKQKGIQAFFQTAYEVDMLNRLKITSELGYQVPVGGPEPLVTDLVIKNHHNDLEGTTVFAYPDLSKEFLAKVYKADPKRSSTGIEAAALAYTHVHQIGRVLKACGKNDVKCHVQELSKAQTSPIIGFNGWKDRVAQFDYPIKVWKDGKYQTK